MLRRRLASVGLITNNLQSLPFYVYTRVYPLFVRACWIAAFNKRPGPDGIFSVNLVRVPERDRKRTTERDPGYFTCFSCSAIFAIRRVPQDPLLIFSPWSHDSTITLELKTCRVNFNEVVQKFQNDATVAVLRSVLSIGGHSQMHRITHCSVQTWRRSHSLFGEGGRSFLRA